MSKVVLVTGASSGFGRMIARDLACAGHVAYASMRGTTGRNAAAVVDSASFARDHGVDLRTFELDVQDETSIEAAVKAIIAEHGRIDVLVHNAGHMTWGPGEAFTPEQVSELYDINVVGSQRVNRAVLPFMRAAGTRPSGLGGQQQRGGRRAPIPWSLFCRQGGAGRAGRLLRQELAPLGIETSIVVPGAFTSGTNHFAHAGTPEDQATADAYIRAYPQGFADQMKDALAATVPDWADPNEVGKAVVNIVAAPHGLRPLRVHVDPASDGAAVSYAVIDRVREQFLARIGHLELLHPRSPAA